MPFVIVDEKGRIFGGASASNQNRLHLGFHYPRSHATRQESQLGYQRFLEEFPRFARDVDTYYFIAQRSILDYPTYTAIFKQESTPFEEVPLEQAAASLDLALEPSYLDPAGRNTCIRCDEKWIDWVAVKQHYTDKYGSRLASIPSAQPQNAELMIDCTYGQLHPPTDASYEVCLTLVYERMMPGPPVAITVMDGTFFSLYPYQYNEHTGLLQYTLTHVKHTPVTEFQDAEAAKLLAAGLPESTVAEKRELMVQEVTRFLPDFEQKFRHVDHYVSIKCKFRDTGTEDRSMRTWQPQPHVLSFCGGKITGVFAMAKHISAFFSPAIVS